MSTPVITAGVKRGASDSALIDGSLHDQPSKKVVVRSRSENYICECEKLREKVDKLQERIEELESAETELLNNESSVTEALHEEVESLYKQLRAEKSKNVYLETQLRIAKQNSQSSKTVTPTPANSDPPAAAAPAAASFTAKAGLAVSNVNSTSAPAAVNFAATTSTAAAPDGATAAPTTAPVVRSRDDASDRAELSTGPTKDAEHAGHGMELSLTVQNTHNGLHSSPENRDELASVGLSQIPEVVSETDAPKDLVKAPSSEKGRKKTWSPDTAVVFLHKDISAPPRYATLVSRFLELENQIPYVTPKYLARNFRPPELSNWQKESTISRSFRRDLNLTSDFVVQFGEATEKYWAKAQPGWRTEAMQPVAQEHGTDWTALEKTGFYGWFGLVACVKWWWIGLRDYNGQDRECHVRKWLAAVDDMILMLNLLLENVKAKRRNSTE